MLSWINKIFSKPKSNNPDLVTLRSECRELELKLQEKETTINNLQTEIIRLRSNLESSLKQQVESALTHLFADISSPISQLLTQIYLVEMGKPVQNRDIISVTNRLINQLKEHGVDFEGKVGEIVIYNPVFHTPLSTNIIIAEGAQVVVRFEGVRFNNAVIKKALVEIIAEGDQ